MKVNVDFAGAGMSNNGKGFLREIDGAAAARWAVVHNFDHHALARARVGVPLICRPRACYPIFSVARCFVVPNGVARRRDHHSVVGVPMAR